MDARLKKWVMVGLVGCACSLGISSPGHAEEAPKPSVETPPKDVEAMLRQQAVAEKRLREEIQTQSTHHMEAGKRLFDAFEYDEARKEFESAVSIDRTNTEGHKWLVKTNDVLGLRKDRIKSAIEGLYGESRVAIQERLAELDNRVDWGNKFVRLAQSDPELSLAERIRKHEQALDAFSRANEIVKWMPPQIKVDEQQNVIHRMIQESRRNIKSLEEELNQSNKAAAMRLAEQHTLREREHRQKKLSALLDQVQALLEIGEYEKAEMLAGNILEQDPTNAEAHAIEASARSRKHASRRAWIDEEAIEQNKLAELRAERMRVPHNRYLVYPSDWQRISTRTGETARKSVTDPWKQEFQKKLARKVSFEFVDTPLNEALQFLDSLAKVNFILDPRADAEGAGKVSISLRVSDMEMEMALKWILRLAELDYELRNQAVFITKKANLAANVELDIYDVRDLTTQINDFPGPRLELGTANNTGSGAGGNPFLVAPPAVHLAAGDLAAMIKDRLLPQEFTDAATSIEENNGKLVVMQRPEVHDRIRQLLKSFRETQTVQVLTNVRYIDVLDGFLEQIGVHFQGLDAAPGTDYDGNAANGFQALPNVAGLNPLALPSRVGLFPVGGGPGIGPGGEFGTGTQLTLPSALDSSVPYQFGRSVNPSQANYIPNPFSWTTIPANTFAGLAASNPSRPYHYPQYFAPLQFPFNSLWVDPAVVTNHNLPFGGAGQNGPLMIRPRLDPNFPLNPHLPVGNPNPFLMANAPAGFRRNIFGPPMLFQGMTQNFVHNLGGNGPLGAQLADSTTALGRQGAIFQFRFFNSSQASAVLHAVKKDQTVDQLIAPRLTQFNNQRAHILVATQRSYIADYDVAGAVYDPVIRSYLVGVVLDLRPTVSYDRKYITMDIRTGTAIDFQPPRVRSITGPGVSLPIDLPDLELRSVSTTATVPDNGSLLLSGLIHDTKIASKSGIPFLSDLPVIGRIFSTNIKHRERRNLLVLINSRVIMFDEEEERM